MTEAKHAGKAQEQDAEYEAAIARLNAHKSCVTPEVAAKFSSLPEISGRLRGAKETAQEQEKDAARFRSACEKDDNAEALYAAVLNNAPDIAAIRAEFDAALSQSAGEKA